MNAELFCLHQMVQGEGLEPPIFSLAFSKVPLDS